MAARAPRSGALPPALVGSSSSHEAWVGLCDTQQYEGWRRRAALRVLAYDLTIWRVHNTSSKGKQGQTMVGLRLASGRKRGSSAWCRRWVSEQMALTGSTAVAAGAGKPSAAPDPSPGQRWLEAVGGHQFLHAFACRCYLLARPCFP